jgi:predicted metalloprotease
VSPRRLPALVAVLALLGACAASDPYVRTRGAQEIVTVDTTAPDSPFGTTPETVPDTEPEVTAAPTPDAGGPVFTLPEDKPERDYDAFLEAAINDIQNFWRNEFPAVYGSEYVELAGGVHPMEQGDILTPGCGAPNTDYSEVEGNAFYCGDGDFVAYDDEQLVPYLDQELGRFAIGIVFAHEWGHAIQFRIGWETEQVIYMEQQADCFAGSWLAHIARGESADGELQFTDADLKGALSAMIFVRDEPGTTAEADPLAHGSAFDRVGAFEDGFRNGTAQCATYPDSPPPIIQFSYDGVGNQENAPLDDPTGQGNDIFSIALSTLNGYWPTTVAGMTELTIGHFTGDPSSVCESLPDTIFQAAFFCPANSTVWVDDESAADIYNRQELGDMGVVYVIATGWAEAVLATLGDPLTGETKSLASDCLVGAYARSVLPADFNGIPDTDPTTGDGVRPVLSPGDLDEAVSTAIQAGDDTEDTDQHGTPFEKIEQFRRGVLGDYAACQSEFGL